MSISYSTATSSTVNARSLELSTFVTKCIQKHIWNGGVVLQRKPEET